MKVFDTPSMPHSKSGFTLIELLTVIAIIGVLAGILIPVVGSVRVSAMESSKASAYRQIGLANQLYANDHNGMMVPVMDNRSNENGVIWRNSLAPYLAEHANNNSQANKSEIYIDPFYEQYDPSRAHESGVGLTANPGLPELKESSAFWSNGANNAREYNLASITFPAKRILAGDVSEKYFITKQEYQSLLDTTRHDNGTRGMFVRFDCSVELLTQEEAELAFTDPQKL